MSRAKLGKSKIFKISRFLLILVLIIGWIFSGWPQIWQNPAFPPEIQEAFAAVAYDAGSESHTGTTGSTSQASFTWNHTPVGTPKGALVFVFTNANAADVTSVTYGGTTMTQVSGGQAIDTAIEPGRTDTFFLGASVPTGVQAVVVNRVNNADVMYATAITVTAATNTTPVGFVLLQNDGTLAEQLVDDGSPGSNSVRFAGINSGLASVPAAGANSTVVVGIDYGARVVQVVRETTAGQGARSVGFSSATSDDRAAVHLAVAEITTILGNGASEPSNVTIGPGDSATDLDNFTLKTNTGTDTVTGAVVTLGPANAYNNIYQVDITDTSNVAKCTAVTSPSSNTITFSSCSISVTTTETTYKVRITPKTHANMPPVPGASYATTGTVTAITCTNTTSLGDTGSATVTVDNESPANATATSGSAGNAQVTLNWTTSASTDISRSVMLRWTGGSAGTEVPAEGTDYVNGNTIIGGATATVVCVRTGETVSTPVSGVDGAGTGGCSAVALTNGQAYTYKIFQKDSNGNYDVGVLIGTFTPQAASTLTFSISANSIGFGTLNTGSPRFANTTGGSDTEIEAHTLSASTNASGGYIITVDGNTLTYSSFTINAIGCTNTGSSPGSKQFGLRATTAGPGTVAAPYAAAGFAFCTTSFPDDVASGAGDGTTTTYSVRYIANTASLTEAGNYNATLTYVATATF